MYNHEVFQVKNGLRVVVVPIRGVESATVMLGAGVGSRYEAEDIAGISHFLEHMAFKGTQKRPKAIDISSEIDAVGGFFNAFTGKEFTGYLIQSSNRHLELSFDILSDMLSNSLFKEEEIKSEKRVIVEEIRMLKDIPMDRVERDFENLIFGKTPLGRDITGSIETVTSLKRKDFLRFVKKFYYPSNLSLVVTGNVKLIDVKRYAKKYFDIKNEGGKKSFVAQKQTQQALRVKNSFKQTEQAHLILGVPAFSLLNKDRYQGVVLSAILGGGMSSRLFTELREKNGLGYYVSCSSDNYLDSGYIAVEAGVDLKRIDLAIKIILKEFEKIAKEKVSEKELKRVKEMIKGRFLLSLESTSRVAQKYCQRIILEGELKTPQEIIREIDKPTPETINEIAKKIFTKNKLNLAVVGPYKEKQGFKKLLESF